MQFEFATATRIVFGAGTLSHAVLSAAEMGSRVMLVTSRNTDRSRPLVDQLTARGLIVSLFSVDSEPTLDTIKAGVAAASDDACDVIIGFGGGSVLDTGKAIAAMQTNGGDPLDYLEVIGRGKPITEPAAPYIAIPTTAGTGAEVTRNSVLGSPEHRVKVSLRSPLMLPRLAVVDPELTYSLPPHVTASTGLDALTQLLEPFVSPKANPMTDALCRQGIRRVARSLPVAFRDGTNVAAREDMALASLYGGLALANAKLGAVHGIAGPLGGMFPAPHGATCAALLPHVMALNVLAIGQRKPSCDSLLRYEEAAQLLTGCATATATDGVSWVQQICEQLQVPALSSYGLAESDFPDVIEKASRSSSMRGNPIELRYDEIHEILLRAR